MAVKHSVSINFNHASNGNIKIVKTISCNLLGFFTGIPQVGFLDTVPVPMNTVPVQPWVQYLQVTGMVSHETCGVGGTCGFLVLFNVTTY